MICVPEVCDKSQPKLLFVFEVHTIFDINRGKPFTIWYKVGMMFSVNILSMVSYCTHDLLSASKTLHDQALVMQCSMGRKHQALVISHVSYCYCKQSIS